jgi:hypothetical protein
MIRPERFVEQKAAGRTPLLNYVERVTSQVSFSDYAQISRKKRLQYLTLRTPELAGMLWDIAEDIVGKYDFIPLGARSSGRNRTLNAKTWARKVKLQDMLLSAVFDVLSTGEGYLYLGANSARIQEEIQKVITTELRDRFYDEAIYSPLFQPIASVTMTNNHDATKLINYTQRISGSQTDYSPREIINIYFRRIAGRVEGFTPVSTIPLQLELLWLLWTNQYDLQAKGNMPDLIVTAKDIRANTPVLKDVEQKLRKYNMPGNSKHGTTILYGSDYNFEKMERDTDLQFADVGKAVTSVVASLFRYPKHRMGIKTKESSSDKDTQGNGDRDYWDLISKFQDRISDILDTQVFEPFFGVQFVFDKSYLHDSVVENTAMRARIDNINLMQNILRQEGKQLSQDAVMQFITGKKIDLAKEELEESSMDLFGDMPMAGSIPNQKDEELSQEKKREQIASEKNNGGVMRQ